jgi:hypothetical protein
MDPFCQPVAEASVSIEGNSFSAKTDRKGIYKIDFVPGQFTIHIKKEGFTTASLQLNVAQPTAVPAADVVLYPRPAVAGIYYVGKKRLEPLANFALRRQEISSQMAFLPGSTNFYLQTGASVLVAAGDAQFIDTLSKQLHLARAQNRSGLILSAPEDSAGAGSAKAEEVGEEKLTVWNVHLAPGAYGWIPLEKSLLGGFVPGETYYGFQVGTDPWSSLPSDLPQAVSDFLARNQNVELTAYDPARKLATLRVKSTGEMITVSTADIEQGRLAGVAADEAPPVAGEATTENIPPE